MNCKILFLAIAGCFFEAVQSVKGVNTQVAKDNKISEIF